MTDAEALDFLAAKIGTKKQLADALGVSAQQLNNWYGADRGISAPMRPAVWAMVNDHGGHLSREWLMQRSAAA